MAGGVAAATAARHGWTADTAAAAAECGATTVDMAADPVPGGDRTATVTRAAMGAAREAMAVAAASVAGRVTVGEARTVSDRTLF